jgi:PPOX class probable F420-dependent enzyme
MWPPEEQEARALLDERDLLGVLGTTRKDGSSLLAPMWFRFDGSRVFIWTAHDRLWVKCITRDPRVSFSVHSYARPWPAVVIRGNAEVAALTAVEVDEEILRISRRYLEPNAIDDYIAGYQDLRTIVTIEPIKVSYASG